ncbi:MAG TPA: condensation domain-containing protein [Puia sp.]|nr:condensation domain-containing protein [Puia sp.]
MAPALINKLRALKVEIDVIDGFLDVKAPRGVMDNSLMEEIKLHKNQLIDFVNLHKSYKRGYFDIERAADLSDYPLSPAQRRLAILSQFEKESVAYNIPTHILLPANHNIENLEMAIKCTIERHEILRTVFKENADKEIRQFILSAEELGFEVCHKDLRGMDNPQKVAESYMEEDSVIPFNLEKGPLLRVAVLQLSDQHSLLYYNMHHIISDGWSTNVLTKDIIAYYDAFNSFLQPQLPVLRIQYKDYTVWQLNRLEEESAQRHKEYWLQQLAGELPVLDLPVGRQRPILKTYTGSTLETYLTKELASELRLFSQERGGSLFIGLLAVLNALFYRYTSQHEFIIGSPLAGRDHVDLENQIGFYVNTVALRNTVEPNDNFETLFSRVKMTTFKAFEHQQYPFDRLVEELKLKRDAARSPVFDVLMVLQDKEETEPVLSKEDTDLIIDRGQEQSKYDLCFIFQEEGAFISAKVTFNPDVYEADIVQRFLVHFKEMAGRLLASPHNKIEPLEYFQGAERHRLLYAFNKTRADYPKEFTVSGAFAEQVKKTPDAIAVIHQDKRLTYDDLDGLVHKYSDFLFSELYVRKGDRVVVTLDHDHQLLAILLAVMKIGAIYVAIDPRTPMERISYIQNDCKSVTRIDQNILFAMNAHMPVVTAFPLPDSKGDDIQFIIYTSGSTGHPKGTLIKSNSISNRFTWMWEKYPFRDDEICCAKTSISFVDHIWEFFGPLLKGIPLVFYAKEEVLNSAQFIKDLGERNVTRIVLVPTLLRELIRHAGLCRQYLTKLDLWISSGEALKKSDVEKFYDTFRRQQVRLLNIYGATEVTADATCYDTSFDFNKYKEDNLTVAPLRASKREIILLGQPILNSQVYIMDESLNILPFDIAGEICIGGACVAAGYINTQQGRLRFLDNPYVPGDRLYRTGDLGILDTDGNLSYVGRKDDMVKINGNRVELAEIEYHLQARKGVTGCAVLFKKMRPDDYKLVAYLVSGQRENTSDLMRYLSEKIPMYMIPSFFVQVEEMPLTSSGKIDKNALPDPEDLFMTTGMNYVAPESEIECKLVAMCENLLKKGRISIIDNFYHIGGDSIKLIQLLSLLKKEGYNISPQLILQAPNLESIARILESEEYKDELPTGKYSPGTGNAVADKHWSIGDRVEISENQRYMMTMATSQGTLGPFILEAYDKGLFELEFRRFLSRFLEISIKFIKEDDKVYQQCVSYNDIQMDITYKYMDLQDQSVISKELNSIYEKEYDLFNGELFRLFVWTDLNHTHKSLLYVAISHSLTDLYTNNILSDALAVFIDSHKLPGTGKKLSNLHFAEWQRDYLTTEAGRKSRDFWEKYLTDIAPVCQKILPEQKTKYIDQTILITGSVFELIKELSRNLNISVSAAFIGFHQLLMKQYFDEVVDFQLIIVNGRDNVIDDIDTSSVLGVMNNFLPVRINRKIHDTPGAYYNEVNSDYVCIRQHQAIPYEIIRKDFLEVTGKNIDLADIGCINFQQLEGEFNENNSALLRIDSAMLNRNIHLDMTCKLRSNGIEILLTCKEDIYKTNKASSLNLNYFIQNMINSMTVVPWYVIPL